jgi:hypothetical protein
MSLSYEKTSDTLVAATFGRGVYVLHNATKVLDELDVIASKGPNASNTQHTQRQ